MAGQRVVEEPMPADRWTAGWVIARRRVFLLAGAEGEFFRGVFWEQKKRKKYLEGFLVSEEKYQHRYVFENPLISFFFTGFHYFFVHSRIPSWCLNMSIRKFYIFMLDSSLFACISFFYVGFLIYFLDLALRSHMTCLQNFHWKPFELHSSSPRTLTCA